MHRAFRNVLAVPRTRSLQNRTASVFANLAIRTFTAVLALALTAALESSASAQSTSDLKALVDNLVAANRILHRQGVLDAFGHVSVRHPGNPEHFLMSAAKAPARVSAEDIMEFDLSGNAIDRRDRPIYAERFIHSEVYRTRPDVNAVVHSHSPTTIPFSVTQVRLRPVHNSAAFLAPEVPVFEMRRAAGITDNVVTSSARGRALVETLGARPVVLLRGHGNVVVGPELRRTVARAVYTEVNARMQLQAIMLGGLITFIDPEEAKLIEAKRDSDGAGGWVDRVWDMWLAEAARTGEPPLH
jgi:ribulose-5-phosphate 4-epimerase/fuculose-1-phosphate aldolase